MDKTSIKYCTKLVQNTPMIHFQHDEEGICLRASEVKPKFDKFIIEQLGGWDKIPDEWHIDDTHHGLKYKMRIMAKGVEREAPHKLYFGDMKAKIKPKKAIYFRNMELSLICNSKATVVEEKLTDVELNLMEILQLYLPYFFAVHTFGQRNSKGFGSFSVAGSPIDDEKLSKFCPLGLYYYIEYTQDQMKNIRDVFDDIWVIYSMMKSGFNFNGDYYKGRIFRYFSEKGIGSDKAFIKKRILPLKENDETGTYRTFYFSRAMLGLSENYEFRGKDEIPRNGNIAIEHNDKVNKIERFQSPIRFKLHGTRLLIIPQTIPQKMFDAEFNFEGKWKGSWKKDPNGVWKKSWAQSSSSTIKTPPVEGKDGFDLIEYLDWFIEEYRQQRDIKQFRNTTVKPTIDKKLKITKVGGQQ